MEAMWTRFQPAVVALRELVADGAIGEVRSVHADLGLAATTTPQTGCSTSPSVAAPCSTSASTWSRSPSCCSVADPVTATGSTFPYGADA